MVGVYCSPEMVRPPGLARAFGLAFISLSLLAGPRAAWADTVYADFDHDGKKDVLSVSPASASTLQVWLSSTQTLRQLRISRPILKIAAFDLDGDGHPEIIASDTSSGLHIWRRTKDGHLRRVRPHRSVPETIRISGHGVARPVTQAADVPAGGADGTSAADPASRAVVVPPGLSGLRALHQTPAVLDLRYVRSGSRAPPVRD
jgi:hypothetical protein